MVGTLTGPTAVVHGSTSLWRQTRLHAAGLLVGAVPVGAAASLLGAVLPIGRHPGGPIAPAVAWAVLALAYAAHELGLARLPHPQRRWQVPTDWRRLYSPRRVAFAYGVLLGPGFLVFIRTSAYYVLVAGVVLIGSPLVGAVAFALMAVGRGVPLMASTLHQQRGGSLGTFLSASVRVDNHARLGAGTAMAVLSGAVLGLALAA